MLDSNVPIINMDAKVSPIVLASILGVNISLVYQEAQAGRLPLNLTEATYKECIQMYIAHFKKGADLKLAKEANEQELRKAKLAEDIKLKEEKFRFKEEQDRLKAESKGRRSFSSVGEGDDGNDGMPPLVAAKMKQDIRLGIAKEAQLWLRIAIERQEYLSVEEVFKLTEPFLQAIKNILVSLASDIPEVQSSIDEGMETLYNLGIKLVENADVDGDKFVERMLEKELDLTDIEINFTSDNRDF